MYFTHTCLKRITGKGIFIIIIIQIPYSVRWQDVKEHFKKAGQVVRVVIAKHQDKQPKGHAFVLFSTIEDAQKAIGKLLLYFKNYSLI